MRGFISGLLILILTFAVAGCAGSTTAPTIAVSGTSIELARAVARIGLSVALQAKGVSPEASALIIGQLHAVVDDLLAGKDVRAIVTDPNRWALLRDDLVKRLGSVIASGAQVNGVKIIDEATADQFAGSLLDSFADALRR
jgi:hypothetical protein